jgi:hypothetical protein
MNIPGVIKAVINYVPDFIDESSLELKSNIDQIIGFNLVSVRTLDVNEDGSVKSLLEGFSYEVYQYLIEAGYASSTEDADSRLIFS